MPWSLPLSQLLNAPASQQSMLFWYPVVAAAYFVYAIVFLPRDEDFIRQLLSYYPNHPICRQYVLERVVPTIILLLSLAWPAYAVWWVRNKMKRA
jgi:hypothetical protein